MFCRASLRRNGSNGGAKFTNRPAGTRPLTHMKPVNLFQTKAQSSPSGRLLLCCDKRYHLPVLLRRDPVGCLFPVTTGYVELNDFRHKSPFVRASNGTAFQISCHPLL